MTAPAPEPFVYVTDPATIRAFLEGDIDVPTLRSSALGRVVQSADRLRSERNDAVKAVERVRDLADQWATTDPSGLMSRVRAAETLRQVIGE